MTPDAQRRVAVVGGGVSGLTAAWELSRSGVDCTLFEPNRLGGVIQTELLEGCLIEGGPDSFLAQKPAAARLAFELGLGSALLPSNDFRRRTYIVRGGKLLPLPDGLQLLAPTKIRPLLASRLLMPAAKCRAVAELFRLPRRRNADVSVAEFVQDHYGEEAVEYLAQPLLAGVYGGSPESLGVEAVLPRFLELERRSGSLSRALFIERLRRGRRPSAPLFLTLRSGLGTLVDALTAGIRHRVRIVPHAVESLARSGGGWELKAGGSSSRFGRLVLATPAWEAARLLRPLEQRLGDCLGAIPYGSSITCSLVYRRAAIGRALDAFGFLVPRAEERLLAACTWVDRKFQGRSAPGSTVLRAFVSGDAASARLGDRDDQVVAAVHAELTPLMNLLEPPAASRIYRWPRAMAQYQVGHRRLVGEIEAMLHRAPDLDLAGAAFDGVGVPDCIARSRRIARDLVRSLGAQNSRGAAPASAFLGPRASL